MKATLGEVFPAILILFASDVCVKYSYVNSLTLPKKFVLCLMLGDIAFLIFDISLAKIYRHN